MDISAINIDISDNPKSLGNYLKKFIQDINKKTAEEMLQIIADAKTQGVNLGKYQDQIITGIKQKLTGFVSEKELNKVDEISGFISLIKNLEPQSKKVIQKSLMYYITNMILGSANLRMDRGAELEAMMKTSSLNEIIIFSVISTNTNL